RFRTVPRALNVNKTGPTPVGAYSPARVSFILVLHGLTNRECRGCAVGFFNFKQWFGGDGKKKVPITDIAKRFDLIGRTGQGSMSKVWRARDRQTGKTVCVKILDKVK